MNKSLDILENKNFFTFKSLLTFNKSNVSLMGYEPAVIFFHYITINDEQFICIYIERSFNFSNSKQSQKYRL